VLLEGGTFPAGSEGALGSWDIYRRLSRCSWKLGHFPQVQKVLLEAGTFPAGSEGALGSWDIYRRFRRCSWKLGHLPQVE
jgi:hypothetical protein